MSVVELIDVRKHYMLGETRVEALRGISIHIEKGEFLAIAGPSGAGKSTILNLIGCIDTPSEGRVLIDGTEVEHLSDKELTRYRRQKLGFIFQSFNLIPVLNVFENIEFPLLLRNSLTRTEREKTVMHFIEEVGLADRLKNKPNELSGGQRQRVAIARALVTKPSILLADEPTGNLDSTTSAEILDLFDRLHREGNTVILVTHERDIALRARRIVVIHDGAISADVPVAKAAGILGPPS